MLVKKKVLILKKKIKNFKNFKEKKLSNLQDDSKMRDKGGSRVMLVTTYCNHLDFFNEENKEELEKELPDGYKKTTIRSREQS